MTRQYDSNYIPIYPDEGCDLHPSCLECPEPECVKDLPKVYPHTERDRKIKELFYGGKTTEELAVIYGLSVRTIERAVARAVKDV